MPWRPTPPDRAALHRAANALRADPDAQLAIAVELLETSRDLEVVRPALRAIEEQGDPALRPLLHRKYLWCAEQPSRRDSSGFIPAGIFRTISTP